MKPNLIVLHGALGSKRYFAKLKEALKNDFNVFDLNFEGHGGNVSEREFTIEHFTENLLIFLKEKELRNVYIFGYSMGGYVALNTAVKNPIAIKKIVTLGTKFNWSPLIAQQEVRMLNPEKIAEKVPQFAASLAALHEPEDWKNVMRKTAELMIGLGEGQGLTYDHFSKISTEVTIGIGDKDKMVTIEESERVADILKNSTFKILSGVPHPIELIDTAVLKEYISEEFHVSS